MSQRIGKGAMKVKWQGTAACDPFMIADEKSDILWRRETLFSLLVILDADLIGDAGMGVREVLAFSVADDLS